MGMALERKKLAPFGNVPQFDLLLSQLALANVFPSELKATQLMVSVWPLSVRNSRPVVTSHNFIVLS